MKHLLHPDFKLNDQTFQSFEDLKERAGYLIEGGKADENAIGKFILEWLDGNDFIYVKTSGSTGVPKTIKLNKVLVKNSAEATIAYFNLRRGTQALLCLPSEYIAGKMMLVRAMIAGWSLYTTSPEKNPLANFDRNFDFMAMVPYQVYHSFSELYKVNKLIVGGGPISKKLENQLQHLNTDVFATYGMTETISHIAIRALNGTKRSSIFLALPGVKFSKNSNDCLKIQAPSISAETVDTNDVVELVSDTSFKLLGRIDNVINSGGVKIHPEIVEEKLVSHITQPFFIASEKDEILGERVVLVLENSTPLKMKDFFPIFETLPNYERPKKILTTPEFIYTETGKVRRMEILENLTLL